MTVRHGHFVVHVAELMQLPYVIQVLSSVVPLRTDSVVHQAAQQARYTIGAFYGRPCPSLRDAAQLARADISRDSFKWASQLNTADSVSKHFSEAQADGHLRRIAEEMVVASSSTYFPNRFITLPPKADIGKYVARSFPAKPPGVFAHPSPLVAAVSSGVLEEDEFYCWHVHVAPSPVVQRDLNLSSTKQDWADQVDSEEEIRDTFSDHDEASQAPLLKFPVLPAIPAFPDLPQCSERDLGIGLTPS